MDKKIIDLAEASFKKETLVSAMVDYLGSTVDVFADNPQQGIGLSIFDYSKIPTREVIFNGEEVRLPVNVKLLPLPTFDVSSGSSTSMDSTSNAISASLGVKAGYGFFSAGAKAKFSASSNSASQFYYTYVYESIALGSLELLSWDPAYFSDDFKADLDALPANFSKDDYPQLARFLEKWGMYFVMACGLGGELDAFNSVAVNSSTTEISAQADLTAQYKGLLYSGEFDASITGSSSWSTFSKLSETQFHVEGGSAATQGKIVAMNPMEPSPKTVEANVEWLESLAEAPSPNQMRLKPISQLAGDKAMALEKAAETYVTAVEFNTSLNYHAPADTPWYGTWVGRGTVYVNGHFQQSPNVVDPGFQVVIVDRYDPSRIVANEFFSYDDADWQLSYPTMYEEMMEFLNGFGNEHIVVLCSQEIRGGAFPTEAMQNYLVNVLGVADGVETWARSSGRQSNNGLSRTLFYAVGVPDSGFNSGAWFSKGFHESYNSYRSYRNQNGASIRLDSNLKSAIQSNM